VDGDWPERQIELEAERLDARGRRIGEEFDESGRFR
jgi:hypothetical protein